MICFSIRKDDKMELYIARHGETEFNKQQRWQGSGVNSPLTQKGIGQAKALNDAIKDIQFDAIYSSPLKRAMDTACLAFADDNLFDRATTDKRLMEIGLGEAEGLAFDEVCSRFPDTYNNLSGNPPAYIPPPGGETIQQVIDRLDSFLTELATKPYERVFVMAHGYVLRVMYSCAIDKSPKTIANSPWYDNCSLCRYVYDGIKWTALAE